MFSTFLLGWFSSSVASVLFRCFAWSLQILHERFLELVWTAQWIFHWEKCVIRKTHEGSVSFFPPHTFFLLTLWFRTFFCLLFLLQVLLAFIHYKWMDFQMSYCKMATTQPSTLNQWKCHCRLMWIRVMTALWRSASRRTWQTSSITLTDRNLLNKILTNSQRQQFQILFEILNPDLVSISF